MSKRAAAWAVEAAGRIRDASEAAGFFCDLNDAGVIIEQAAEDLTADRDRLECLEKQGQVADNQPTVRVFAVAAHVRWSLRDALDILRAERTTDNPVNDASRLACKRAAEEIVRQYYGILLNSDESFTDVDAAVRCLTETIMEAMGVK